MNRCNLGYAFVNLISHLDVLQFHHNLHGRAWSTFNSSKICELAYARIQGKQNLIAHFQHSRIMSERKEFLPVIMAIDGNGLASIEEEWLILSTHRVVSRGRSKRGL